MSKPSIFSKDYEQKIKRRRINIILFVLIIISASFFGIRYYLDKNNINFALKIPWSKITINKNKKDNDKDKNKVDSTEIKKEEPKDTKDEKNNIGYFEYRAIDGSIYKIEYDNSSAEKQITDIKSDGLVPFFDISKDKNRIVFEDRKAGDIIVMDRNGAAKKINVDSYTSKSGIVIRKDNMMKKDPQYIWTAKPHFTMDGGVVYVSRLPYISKNGFYLWYVGANGGLRFIGRLSDSIDNITYDGFTEDNALKIKVDNSVYYLPLGGYRLKK